MLPEFGEIWLSPLRDNCQFTYLRRKKEKKKKTAYNNTKINVERLLSVFRL
jgi:hypothetical protein